MNFMIVVLCFGAFLPYFHLECKAFGHIQYGRRNSENTFIDRLHVHRAKRNVRENATSSNTNGNCTKKINHRYYVSQTFISGQKFWRNIEGNPNKIVHADLSKGRFKKKTLKLNFKFPYYGHYLESVLLTTGGFLYMDVYNTSPITDVQFVAPLMAYFSLDHHPDSQVTSLDDGSQLTVQWSRVYLLDRTQDGHFTFQCTLHKNGTIWFAYKEIPVNVSAIADVRYHPVKVGISDAFVKSLRTGRTNMKYRVFHIYSVVNITKDCVLNGSAVEFRPQTSCVSANSCTECIKRKQTTEFECQWCSQIQRCSDGSDRHRQEWDLHGCSANGVKHLNACLSIAKNSTSCVSANSCTECIKRKQTTEFECQWCPQIQRCSNATDRHRAEWDLHSCSANAFKQLSDERCGVDKEKQKRNSKGRIGSGAVVLLLIIGIAAYSTVC